MEPQEYSKEIPTRIRLRITSLRGRGKLTSKGEPMSLAAVGRTCEPPVSRNAVYNVVDGRRKTKRIRRAIERELGENYWIRNNDK
jgi:hypothetical protein